MNFAQEIEPQMDEYTDQLELLFRMECLERRLGNLEAWLGEVASDVLDRFQVAPIDEECATERIGS
jgi:hypothetical protein